LREKPSHADVGSDPAPQVVIGVTGPRPEGRDSEVESHTRAEHGAGLNGGRVTLKPTLEMLAEPTLELIREAERLELVREPSSPDIAATLAEAEPLRSELPEVATAMPAAAELVKLESAAHVEAQARAAQPAPDDEVSIPPAGDLSVEPIADRFFSEGEVVAAHGAAGEHEHEHEWAEVVARQSRKSLPEVVERRARLSKYVRWAVGGAAVLCLAALGRTLVAPAPHASTPPGSAVRELAAVSAVARVEAPEPKAAAVAVAVAPPASAAAAEPTVAPEVEKTAEALAAASAVAPAASAAPAVEPAEPARVEAPKVDIPKAEAPAVPAEGEKTALQEKNDARRALERGKAADAIAAGERSVALDPTDGEAWLLLGAAYQEKGKMSEARRAYTACTKEGKRGPVGECRAMLR